MNHEEESKTTSFGSKQNPRFFILIHNPIHDGKVLVCIEPIEEIITP